MRETRHTTHRTAASPSFNAGSPASRVGSSEGAQTLSKVDGNVVLECTGPVPVEFSLFPKYAGSKKGPWCVHCYNVLEGKKLKQCPPRLSNLREAALRQAL